MENNLKQLRKQRGLTQKEVATLLGLKCEDRISHWEKGKAMPNISNLMKISRVLGVTIDQLFK